MSVMKHRHDFHGLWDHFGPLGRQDVHYHPCIEDCSRVLMGPGHDCDGDPNSHWRETL